VWGEINKDSLRFPSLQGWFWGGESPGKGTVVGRFYLSLQHTKAAAFWKVLSEVADGLKKQGITIRYKMGAYLTSMQRGDSAVVYFNVKDQKAVHQNVAELAQKNPTFFKGNIPVFAAQVLDSEGKPVRGLSFGQNPEEEFSSFGSKRSEAITAANREIREFLARGESISVEDAYKVMAYYLDKYEVDVQYPACEKGGIDQFKFVIEHTDQGK